MIICAAIKFEFTNIYGDFIEAVVCGHRHSDCYKTFRLMLPSHKSKEIQGFINHKGEFLDRKEAFEHAKECGQCNETQRYYWEDHNQDELYSEDLY